MKKVLTLSFLINFNLCLAQQNLVPNWSFEDTLPHNGCITGIEIANKWFNPNAATPDLYSYEPSCIISSFNNPSGYQIPRTGLCYGAIYGYLNPTREYLAIKLDSLLSIGCSYYIEFFISRANNFGMACDKLGAAFTNDTAGFGSISKALLLIPAIQSPPGILLTDSMNWVSVSGNYIANGTEEFLIIGNFYADQNTTWSLIDSTALILSGAYYYIDDVTVLSCGTVSVQQNEKNPITIQHNSFSNEIKINCDFENTDAQFLITDALGQIILKQKFQCVSGKDIFIKMEDNATGIYFATISTYNYTITKKLILKK